MVFPKTVKLLDMLESMKSYRSDKEKKEAAKKNKEFKNDIYLISNIKVANNKSTLDMINTKEPTKVIKVHLVKLAKQWKVDFTKK